MILTPLRGKVLIRPDEPTHQSPSGLELISYWNPDISGTIVAIGPSPRCPSCQQAPPAPIEIGDHVLFSNRVGEEVDLEGSRYLIMDMSQLLATLHAGTDQ